MSKSKLGDIDGIIEIILNDNKTKLCIVSSSSNGKRRKENVKEEGIGPVAKDFFFRVRRCTFSLSFQAIRPSKFFGARRKFALCSEAYEWALVLRSFDKLREVGVLSYLSFTLCLSVFMMFELIEIVSGRLIGFKAWNRIVRKI